MINRDTILHLADLARIKVTTGEADDLTGDLEDILTYVGALKNVDTKGISRADDVGVLRNVWRDDEVLMASDATVILAEAPAHEKGYVKVPKVHADF